MKTVNIYNLSSVNRKLPEEDGVCYVVYSEWTDMKLVNMQHHVYLRVDLVEYCLFYSLG